MLHPKIKKLDSVVDNIINHGKGYPPEFVNKINQQTGILKDTIRGVLASLPSADNSTYIKNIAGTLLLKAFTYPSGKNDLRSKLVGLYAHEVNAAYRALFREMDGLMARLDCGKKRFADYSDVWQRKLKLAVIIFVAFHMTLNRTTTN